MSNTQLSDSPQTEDSSEGEIPLIQIVEALLFATRQSLTVAQIKKIIGVKEAKRIPALITELNTFYRETHRAFFIQKVAGGYQLRTAPRFRKWIRKGRVVKPIQLSPTVMETLAIVAYRQPATRAEIENIRSVDATYAIRALLDKKLLKITGRKDIAGRPLLYGTTSFFLEVFGFDTIEDLPRPEEIDILPDQAIEPETIEAT